MKNQISPDAYISNFIENTAKKVESRIIDSVREELSKYSLEKKIPPYINTTGFYELTGISYKKQSYLRSKRKIGFSQNGKSITYKREDVEKFLEEHHVPAKIDIN